MKYSYEINAIDELNKLESDIRTIIAVAIIFLIVATLIFCAIDDANDKTQDNQTPIEQTEIVDTVSDIPTFRIVYDNAEEGYQLVKIAGPDYRVRLYVADVTIDEDGNLQYISFTPVD